MAKKTQRRQIADEAIQKLKDAIKDIDILGDGRGTTSRYFACRKELWDA